MKTALRVAVLVILVTCTAHGQAPGLQWFDRGALTPQAVAALNLLNDATVYGLEPAHYALALSADEVRRAVSGRATSQQQTRFDSELTTALRRFVAHVHFGRVAPESLGFHLRGTKPPFDADHAVAEVARAPDVLAAITQLEPGARPYRTLKQALRYYRTLAQDPTLTQLAPFKRSLRAGETYADAAKIARLLVATGDLQQTHVPAAAIYTAELAAGIARFQLRHGLTADGVIGRATYGALTTPLTERVRQIELTLERWRWTSTLPRPDIVVNVPQFMLFALPRANRAEDTLEMRVIVGKSYPHTRTPVFTADLTHVIFQPYWECRRASCSASCCRSFARMSAISIDITWRSYAAQATMRGRSSRRWRVSNSSRAARRGCGSDLAPTTASAT